MSESPDDKYRASFLWPPEEGSIEQAGYEFANANTPAYQELRWNILVESMMESRWEPKNGR